MTGGAAGLPKWQKSFFKNVLDSADIYGRLGLLSLRVLQRKGFL